MKKNTGRGPRIWNRVSFFCILSAVLMLVAAPPASAERIKDLASIQGVRDNQLIGYGLVVGLDGSGDQTTQTPFTVQSTISMLAQLGVTLPPGTSLQLKNVAAVMVTATLPPFARAGQTIDITASSIGNAKSLRGGTLLMTPLKGADGQVYAMAQGNMLVGGVGAASCPAGSRSLSGLSVSCSDWRVFCWVVNAECWAAWRWVDFRYASVNAS